MYCWDSPKKCPGQKEFSEKVTPVIHQELHEIYIVYPMGHDS
jgi:hypothetical protein